MALLVATLCSLALLAPQKQKQPKRPPPPPPPLARLVVCTPASIACDGAVATPVPNPLAAALARAGPGTRIELGDGDYPGVGIGFDKDAPWNARTVGGSAGAPVMVVGKGRARIVAGKADDAISVSQQVKHGFITFQNLDIVPGNRAGVLFAQGAGVAHEGYRFLDCNIVGQWDHLTDSGEHSSKWGVYGRGLKDFEFRGVTKRVRIVDLRREHAFYLQNLRGDVLIENVDAARIGRTFVQLTAREKEGPPGVGTVTIRNCTAEDCCLAAGDGYKGGSAFTFCGRHTGTILLEKNRVRAGFVPALRKLTQEGVPYGTGALVAWDGREGSPTARLILQDNDFELQSSCGDRPLVKLSACTNVVIRGKNRFVAGANPSALELEAVEEGQAPPPPVGSLSIAPETAITGPIRWRGSKMSLEELLSHYGGGQGTESRTLRGK